jgi:hypothetical protein
LTTYDFIMAFSLAWFSAITHLATLDVLRDYLINHTAVRNLRISGMVCMLVLLLFFLGATTNKPDDSIPIQCLFDHPEMGSLSSSGVLVDPLSVLSLLALAITALFLLMNYLRRIRWSLGKSNRRLMTRYYLIFALWRRYDKRSKALLEHHNLTSEGTALFLERLAMNRVFVWRRKQLEGVKNPTSTLLYRELRTFMYALALYSHSFISVTPDILFMLSYGITQSVGARWNKRTLYSMMGPGETETLGIPHETTVELDSSMGFGQVTPVFLLILPLLAAAEIYYGELRTGNQIFHSPMLIEVQRLGTKRSPLASDQATPALR